MAIFQTAANARPGLKLAGLLLLLLAGEPAAGHAQSSPTISIVLSPGHMVPQNTAITATVTLDNLDPASYSSLVFRADLTEWDPHYPTASARCEGDEIGEDITVEVAASRETFTVEVWKSCSAYIYAHYALDAALFRLDSLAPGGKVELASAETWFAMSRYLRAGENPPPPPAPGVAAWLDPDPTSFEWKVGEWVEFRPRTDVLLYLNHHLGVNGYGSRDGARFSDSAHGADAEEACQHPDAGIVNWRRAINQPIQFVACRAGEATFRVWHERASEVLYTYEFRISPAEGVPGTPPPPPPPPPPTPPPTPPRVMSITSEAAHPTKDQFTVTIIFTEEVTGLTAGEIVVINGLGSNFAGAGASYTLDIEPSANIEDDVTVRVPAAAAVDGGNIGNLEGSETFAVDTRTPTVSTVEISSNPGADQTYTIGNEIEVTVQFSETVLVEGTPQLRLRVGSRTRTAGYLRGTDTAALVFVYEVAEGDEDSDGVSIEAGRIALNGGMIEDEADNDAVLDHDRLAPNSGHKVDGVRPELSSAAVDGSSLTLTYGEALDGGSRPTTGDFTVEVDGSGRSVTGVSVSGSVVTLTLNPAVEHGDTGIRMSYTPDTNPIRDEVGNEALALSNRSVTNTTGAPNTAPEITSPSSFEVPENQALARRLVARDSDPGDEVTGWAIVGGADQGQFTITTDTGELSFRTAPDYEAPGDNQYEVTVEVRSGAGARELEAEQTITLRVTDEREPPGIPEAPAFSGETADSLTVSWSEPDNSGPPITDYDVQYREGGSGGFTDAQHEGPGLAATLSGLKEGTAYQVQVRATNEEGTSDWSEPGEGMTVAPLRVPMTSDLPPPVESAFAVRFSFSETVRGFTSSDIVTRQEPPCTDSANNLVFCNPSFAALQTTDDRIFTTAVTPRTDQVARNYTLTLTVPAGRVTSAAGNKPNEEARLEVRVAPPGVTVPMSSISLRANAGNGQVTLSWNAPDNSGGAAIVRYEYRWGESGGEFGDWMRVAPSMRAATVRNLTNGTEYVFEVRGANALGYGMAETAMAVPERRIATPTPRPPGNGGGFGGLLFAPEAPASLTAMPGDGTVRLEWSPPESDGGTLILRYEYRIKEIRGEFGEWTPIEDSAPDEVNASGYTVGGLLNGTVYVFELRAVNLVGNGRVSEAVEVVMGLDRANWSNFRGEDLQGAEASLEHTPFGGTPRSLRLRFGAGLRFEESELDGEGR